MISLGDVAACPASPGGCAARPLAAVGAAPCPAAPALAAGTVEPGPSRQVTRQTSPGTYPLPWRRPIPAEYLLIARRLEAMQLGAHINQFGVIGMVQGHAGQSVTGTVLAPAHVPGTRSWPGAREAAAADASAGDPDEGLYWPGSASPGKLSSPLHLHKCWPGTYTVILAVVPPCAGECRSVRVTSVLIFARAPGLCCLCVGPTPGRPGTSARSRIAPRPPLRAARTGIRPAAIDAPVPAGGGTPPQRSAPADPPAPDHTNAGKDHRAHQARLSITPAHWPAPGGNALCAYCPSPTTTHSKEKRLLSMSKPRRTLNRNA